MDILYIHGNPSSAKDLELQCSLRSITEYGMNIDRVFMVGYCPSWLSDKVTKIPCEDIYKDAGYDMTKRNLNIAYKVLYAIEHSDIGEEFLVSMDDHFYMERIDFNNYPYFASQSVTNGFLHYRDGDDEDDSLYTEPTTDYTTFLRGCGKYLRAHGLPTYYFCSHRNLHISRKAISECKDMIDECFERQIPLELFVLINNYRLWKGEIVPTVIKDIKISSGSELWKIAGSNVFSTYDFEYSKGLTEILKGMYPKPCKYEKPVVYIEKPCLHNEKVSIIVPLHNDEKYVCGCIESIKAQTYQNFECIIIDDGSTDNSSEVVDSVINNDSRFRVIHTENGGVSQARNYGIELSSGAWISFVDSDDTLATSFIEKMLGCALSTGNDWVMCGMCWNMFPTREYSLEDKFLCSPNYIRANTIGSLIRKESIGDVQFRNIKWGEDTIFNVELLLKLKKVFIIDEVLYNYIKRPDSVTKNTTEQMREDFIACLNDLSQDYKSDENYDILKDEIIPTLVKRANKIIK